MPRQRKRTKQKVEPSIKESPVDSIFKESPVYDLLQNFEKAPDQWAARYILVISSILLRTAVGLGGFLGKGSSPMHGDFEAQRHWMELTIHLPISEWYFYDLEYWGLDYPPLTAFHLYICGQIGSFINPDWFALFISRGAEDEAIKFFMRVTSLISELIFYIPSILTIASVLGKKFNLNRMDQIIISLIILNQAHLVLIDHGHFQFNSVMLGFFVCSLIELIKGHFATASIWFICCINFKQMGLYYSTFIFVFILSQLKTFQQLVTVGFTVIATSIAILVPFILTANPGTNLLQILIRVFPFNRGLFEDKVANFWCTTNIVVKYREIIDSSDLSKLSLITTIGSILFINSILFYKLRYYKNKVVPGMIIGFAGNSLAFYLFSYQVHEKSILIPLLPTLLLLFVEPDLIDVVQWVNNVGSFSLYPLLKKDGLVLQYFVTNLVINWLIGYKLVLFSKRNWLWSLIIKGSYLAIIGYHLIDWLYDPPAKFPDLWVVLNVVISFGSFMVFWVWLNWRVYVL